MSNEAIKEDLVDVELHGNSYRRFNPSTLLGEKTFVVKEYLGPRPVQYVNKQGKIVNDKVVSWVIADEFDEFELSQWAVRYAYDGSAKALVGKTIVLSPLTDKKAMMTIKG